VEREIPRRRFVPGSGWTSHVPNVLRTLMLIYAAFSAITAIFPALARSLSGVREVMEDGVRTGTAEHRLGGASGHLRIGARQA
jgi:hypothetical protein